MIRVGGAGRGMVVGYKGTDPPFTFFTPHKRVTAYTNKQTNSKLPNI